jgi:hypothetical protein
VANTYSVTFTYGGDSNYKSVSGSGSIQIISSGKATTTTTASMSGSISPNSTIKVTGTVTGSGTTAPTGGIIVFSSGNYLTGNSQISFSSSSGNVSSFSFSLNSAFLAQGANFVTLQYTGDTTYGPSAFTLNSGGSIANPLSDFTLVPSSSNVPVVVGNSGTSSIYLSSVNGFAGTVNLTCTAAAGVTCSIPSSTTLTSGGNISVALNIGAPSTAANGNYNVKVVATDSTGQYIHTLGFTAMVTGATSATPGFTLTNSGNITITAGATSGNTSTISVNPTNGFTGAVGLTCAVTTSPSGATSPVTCAMAPASVNITSGALTSALTVSSTSTTTPGAYAITVSGVNGTNTQTSVVNVTVNAVATGTFALTNSGNITVSRGATTGNTSTITVTPSGGFTGIVNLTCAITPTASNAPATCSLSPSSANITSASPATPTLTVSTTAATALNEPLKLFWPSTGGAVLALLFFFVPRRRRNWLAMMGLLIVLVSGIAIGCGGGGGGGNNGGGGNTGTTPGTYTVTVTGTNGSTSKTTAVTLTVN